MLFFYAGLENVYMLVTDRCLSGMLTTGSNLYQVDAII